MNPQLLQQLMLALGYSPQEVSSDILVGAGNALTLNQLPTVAALGSAALGGDYNQALERAFAGRQAIKERSPMAYTGGELLGSAISPLNKVGAGSALGRVASGVGQAAAYQAGEQGANPADIQAAATQAGILSTGLEAIPIFGKAMRGLQGTLQESGLGLRGAAMKKAGSKAKDKTILGEGYDLVKNLLRKGEGNADAIKEAQKVLTGSANRAGSYLEVADSKIKELVKKQEDIVLDATNKLFKTTKVGNQKIMLPKSKVPAIEFDLNQAKNYVEAGNTGRLTSAVGQDIGTFRQDYQELVKDIIDPIQQAKAAGTKPAINLEDLLVLRRKLSGKYNQYAEQGKAKVYTSVVDDLNRAITNNLKNYENAGVLKAGVADEFKQAGKDMQKLITFNDAVTLSAAGKGNLAMPGDLAKAVTSGGGLSMAAYFAGASNPLVATAIGSFGSMPSVQGAAGRLLEQGLDVAEFAGASLDPLARAAIATQTAETPSNLPSSQPMASQPAVAEFESFLQGLGPSMNVAQPTGSEGAVQAPTDDFSQFLNQLGPSASAASPSLPSSANTAASSPANGDLPSQQLGLKQDAALSPDAFGGLADYYAALAQTESSMNPLAANPNSSAKGLFQFVDKTAQNVGLQDPFDPRQSLAAVQQLTGQHRQQFGDNPELLYAAHYLGQPTLSAWQSGQPLQPNQQDWVQSFSNQALPRFRNQLQAVQQPDSGIRQQFMDLFG